MKFLEAGRMGAWNSGVGLMFKSLMIKVLAFTAYWSGLDALFYLLNRKAKRILTFHNILPDDLFFDGIANGVSNRLSDFAAIIRECRRKFGFSTDLFDNTTITITFDDGYRNQYSIAFKELRKLDIPAYVFVAGDADGGLKVDLLAHWIDLVPEGRYKIGRKGEYVEINNANRNCVWTKVLWPMFMGDAARKGAGAVEKCCRAYPIANILALLPGKYVNERLCGIGNDELDEMRNSGWKVGWHTKSHFPLSALFDEDLENELESPAEFKKAALSYPYGSYSEVGGKAIERAEKQGYPCAVSNSNEAKENRDKFFLPRMSLAPEKYRLHLQLSGIEYFIKYRRLLPRVVVGARRSASA